MASIKNTRTDIMRDESTDGVVWRKAYLSEKGFNLNVLSLAHDNDTCLKTVCQDIQTTEYKLGPKDFSTLILNTDFDKPGVGDRFPEFNDDQRSKLTALGKECWRRKDHFRGETCYDSKGDKKIFTLAEILALDKAKITGRAYDIPRKE
jgi:hypothetical protein